MTALALGLVRSTTTRPQVFAVDALGMRLRRMKKSVVTSARLLADGSKRPGFRGGKWAMVTLTYRDVGGWSPNHVRDFLHTMRKYLARIGEIARYVWVLELQKRGAPHYHVLVHLPQGRTLPKPDKQGWWPHGLTKIEWARRAVGYIAKYASKGPVEETAITHALPKGARLHGVGGLDRDGRIEVRWWKLPLWVRQQWAVICDVCRIKGGYVQRETGEFLRSPWHVFIDGAGRIFCWKDT